MLALVFLVCALYGIIAPNTSLATVPCAYFGGNYVERGPENIEMLAKMRIVMIEKWEGPCWGDCVKNGTNSPGFQATCGVEDYIIRTFKKVKAINPTVSNVFYWNTFFAFPFYRVVGEFKKRSLLAIDTNGNLISLHNDNGLGGIYIYSFYKEEAVQFYIDVVKNWTSTGFVDGFFGDKWDIAATKTKSGQWQLCNPKHGCGNITEAQGIAWNKGKTRMLEEVTKFVDDGPYFQNGFPFEGVSANLNGAWANDKYLKSGDPRKNIKDVQIHLSNHTYFYMSCTDDQYYTVHPNSPSALKSKCTEDQLARFLLVVEPGCFLGTNGWDEAYERPLGDPLGPAKFLPARRKRNATLTRRFSSGTYVVFTYDESEKDGSSKIYWSDDIV